MIRTALVPRSLVSCSESVKKPSGFSTEAASCHVEESWGLNNLPLLLLQSGMGSINDLAQPPAPTTHVSFSAMEMWTCTFCGGVPTCKAKFAHGPSLSSLDVYQKGVEMLVRDVIPLLAWMHDYRCWHCDAVEHYWPDSLRFSNVVYRHEHG